ncbi:MAG TPA: alpha/beta fold hydrolase [Magnetospirillaceae bacterium]|nr:alpha/beta fold hydrolase [Magnetospirillaceae bacterium]
MRISFSSSFRRRALSALLIFGLLLAQGARAQVAPEIGADFFRASDGAELPMRSWLPQGKPRAVIVGLHGFADYSYSYARPAALWAKKGIATFAYDQRGFGAAPHVLHWSGSARMIADATEAAATLRQRYPGVPVFLIGESMGGAVATAATAGPHPASVDGVILVAPAVWEHSVMGSIERTALWLTRNTLPNLWLTPPPGLHIQPSDNIPMLRQMSRDSLVQSGARADTTAGLMDLMDLASDAVSRIHLPTLVLYGAHEQILPHSAVAAFLARVPASNVRVAFYPNGYHMLLRDLDGDIVAGDVAAWIADRAGPLPSGNECGGVAATSPPCRNR